MTSAAVWGVGRLFQAWGPTALKAVVHVYSVWLRYDTRSILIEFLPVLCRCVIRTITSCVFFCVDVLSGWRGRRYFGCIAGTWDCLYNVRWRRWPGGVFHVSVVIPFGLSWSSAETYTQVWYSTALISQSVITCYSDHTIQVTAGLAINLPGLNWFCPAQWFIIIVIIIIIYSVPLDWNSIVVCNSMKLE